MLQIDVNWLRYTGTGNMYKFSISQLVLHFNAISVRDSGR